MELVSRDAVYEALADVDLLDCAAVSLDSLEQVIAAIPAAEEPKPTRRELMQELLWMFEEHGCCGNIALELTIRSEIELGKETD